MKKLFTMSFVSALATLCITACGEDPKPEFTANASGVEPVVLQLQLDKVPASAEGLYDAFTTEEVSDDYEGDYTILHFTLNGSPVMNAYLYGNEIGSIEIVGSKIGSPEGVCPGMKVSGLFAKGGKAAMSNDGQFTITLGNLNFRVSGLKPAAEMKLQNAYSSGTVPPIDAKDFESDAKVESILIY